MPMVGLSSQSRCLRDRSTFTISAVTRLLATLIALVVLLSGRSAEAQCEDGETRVQIEIDAVSRVIPCGRFGLSQAVVRARVLRHQAGPRLGPTFMGVIVCPSSDLAAGQRLLVCVGGVEPQFPGQLDEFPTDRRPRRLLRILTVQTPF